MVTVRIKNTGEYIDVDGSITFVKQVADMGDITKATSSYSWQLTFPKTPKNVKAFRGLGIAGSMSKVPYQKIVCEVMYNGQIIESNGNLIITETKGENYKGHVKAGIIDFLQDVSNDKISDVIDLSDLSHENTVSNIINSFTANLPYKYIVAYYNGSPLPDESGVTNLNPFALVPSISIQYLWDAIFDYYGWTYSGVFDLTDTYMTYPNAVKYDESGASQVLDSDITPFLIFNTTAGYVRPFNINSIDSDYINQVSLGVFRVDETGNYKINANFIGISYYRVHETGLVQSYPLYYRILVNGLPVMPWVLSAEEVDVVFTIPSGTLIVFEFNNLSTIPLSYFINNVITQADLSISSLGVETIDFSEALIKVKVKDFFKEIMIRNALTPFVDVENKAIRFKTLDERLNADKIDWTSKYVKQGRSEKYIYNSYAQKNIVKHKYNDENVDWADGVLLVDNANQPDEKNLYSSFTYAPNEGVIEYHGDTHPVYYVQNFRMFDVEIEEDPDTGDLIPKYKQLKDRFYFIKAEQRVDDIYVLGDLAEEFPLAIYSEVFSDIIDEDYTNMFQLIQDAKIIDIELNLSLVDVVMLDFYKRYYFNQEKAYFILNKITWKPNQFTKAEIIKINS